MREEIEALSNIIQKNPNDLGAINRLAEIFAQNQDYDNALEVYEDLSSKFSDNLLFLINAGNIHFYRQDWETNELVYAVGWVMKQKENIKKF